MNVTWAGKIYNEVYKLGQRIENLSLFHPDNKPYIDIIDIIDKMHKCSKQDGILLTLKIMKWLRLRVTTKQISIIIKNIWI